MKGLLNVLYKRILYKIPLKFLLILLAVFWLFIAQTNADYYSPNSFNVEDIFWEESIVIYNDRYFWPSVNWEEVYPINFQCWAENCCIANISSQKDSFTLEYCEDIWLILNNEECTFDEERWQRICILEWNTNITYTSNNDNNTAFEYFELRIAMQDEQYRITWIIELEWWEWWDNSWNDLISSAWVIINWLENTVNEVIPYVVYIWLWILGLIIWFVAIRWLINFIRNNILTPFK